MRKILAFSTLFAIALIALTACSGPSSVNPERLKIDKPYAFAANIGYGAFTAAGEFERMEAERWTVTLTEPSALAGVVMTYDNGEVTSAFENMQVPDYNTDSVVKRVISAFENGVNGEGREVSASGDTLTITSRAGNPANSYELVFDKNTLEPLSLNISEKSLTATFAKTASAPVMKSFLR